MPCTLALGTDYKTGFGGKGANQCIMAAKLGVTTAMVGALSTDPIVKAVRENFRICEQSVPLPNFTHLWTTQVGALGTDAIAKDTRENFRQFGVKTQFLAEKQVSVGVANVFLMFC